MCLRRILKILGLILLIVSMNAGVILAYRDMAANPPALPPLLLCLFALPLLLIRSVQFVWPLYLVALALLGILRYTPMAPKRVRDE